MGSKVTFDDTGVVLEDGPRTTAIRWKDTDRIFVFKKDLVVVDLICTTIEAGSNVLNFDEDAEGWLQLVEGLPVYLPGCIQFAEWFEKVAFPAFATNPILIYKRGAP